MGIGNAQDTPMTTNLHKTSMPDSLLMVKDEKESQISQQPSLLVRILFIAVQKYSSSSLFLCCLVLCGNFSAPFS